MNRHDVVSQAMGRATIWRPRDCRQTNWPPRGDILAPRRWKPGDPVSAFPPKNEKGSQGWCVRACDSSKSSVAQSLTNVLCNARGLAGTAKLRAVVTPFSKSLSQSFADSLLRDCC